MATKTTPSEGSVFSGRCVALRTLPAGATLRVVTGSIIDEKVDVIVNATHNDLDLSKGGLSSALLQAAGDTIQMECTQHAPTGADTGTIVATSGGKLACIAIYHGVVAKWESTNGEKSFQNVLDECLAKATIDGMVSLAMSAIGSGHLGFPPDATAKLIDEGVTEFCTSNVNSTLKDIRVVVLPNDKTAIKAFQSQMNSQGDPSLTSTILPVTFSTKEGIEVMIKRGSIVEEQVDVIVNSTSHDLDLSNGYISSAILRAGGAVIQKECHTKMPNGLEFGKIVQTSSGQLPCKAIYHGPIPRWNGTDSEAIFRTYLSNIFSWAHEDDFRSLALPPIGTGKLQYPTDTVARLVYEEVATFSRKHTRTKLKDIRIVLFEDTVEAVVAFTSQLCLLHGESKTIDGVDQKTTKTSGKSSASLITQGPNFSQRLNAMTMPSLPKNWKTMKMDLSFTLVPLLETEDEHRRVAKSFCDDGGPSNILQIQRVQNPVLYMMYSILKSNMVKHNSDQTKYPVERVLYHGANEDSSRHIANRGFNRTNCGIQDSALGEGVYFGTKATWCTDDKRSEPDTNGYKHVFKCLVLTGQYTQGDQALKEPPIKDPVRSVRFDSVVDKLTGPEVFAVFHDAQAYPEYLITFK